MSTLIGIHDSRPWMSKRYIDRYGFDTKWARQFQGELVYISTDKGLWREGAQGYTGNPAEAGKFDVDTAWSCIKDLGPEKYAKIVLAKQIKKASKKDLYLVEISATIEVMAESREEAAQIADLLAGPLEVLPGVVARHRPKTEAEANDDA